MMAEAPTSKTSNASATSRATPVDPMNELSSSDRREEPKLQGKKRSRPEWRSNKASARGHQGGRPRRHHQQQRVPPEPTRCSQCNSEAPKYKCPACRATYCGVACCRTHKEKGCNGQRELSAQKQEQRQSEAKSKYLPSDLLMRDPLQNSIQRRRELDGDEEEFDEGWKITKEMMDSMDSSVWLKRELQDGGLRHIISNIDAASNRVGASGQTGQEVALDEAKSRYPPFQTFVDKLLTLTGIVERQEGDEIALEEWLEFNAYELGPLALKPIPRKSRPVLPPELEDSEPEDGSSADDESSSEEASDSSDDSSTSGEHHSDSYDDEQDL